MTLIVACVNMGLNPAESFIAVSDILISDSSDDPGDRNKIPFQFGLITENSATLGRRLASKAALFGNYLLQWSGSTDCARILIKLVKNERPNSFDEFSLIFDEALRQGRDLLASRGISCDNVNLSAILNFSDGTSGWFAQRNNLVKENSGIYIITSGTGQEAFINAHRTACERFSIPISSSVIPTIFNLFVDEITKKSHKWDVYGGGYEIFCLKSGGGFRRLRYTICEVSHYDHINSLYVSGWFVSRLIQCIPMIGGSRFQTVLLPSPNSHKLAQGGSFDAIEEDCKTLGKFDGNAAQDVDFGVCLAIDKFSICSTSSTPTAKFEIDGKIISFELNEERIQEVLDKYVEKHGADIVINTSEDLNYLTCSKCGKKSNRMNFGTIKDENGIVMAFLHLCDYCR